MAFLIDNLTAVVVGSVLMLTLLTLQMRDRQAAVVDTIAHGVRIQLQASMEVVGDDLENMWSPDEAVIASGEAVDPASISWRADTLASGFTQRLQFPAFVRLDDTATNRALAEVSYDLIPSSDTVFVGGAVQFRHTLVRTASFARLTPAVTPSTQTDTLSRDLISLRLGFVSGVIDDRVTWEGPADEFVHSVTVASIAARPGPEDLSTDVVNVGFSNAVSYGGTFTPKNL